MYTQIIKSSLSKLVKAMPFNVFELNTIINKPKY